MSYNPEKDLTIFGNVVPSKGMENKDIIGLFHGMCHNVSVHGVTETEMYEFGKQLRKTPKNRKLADGTKFKFLEIRLGNGFEIKFFT